MTHEKWIINSFFVSSCNLQRKKVSLSSYDFCLIIFQKFLQRESEEIENNEAEDAEGLNEEVKKNDEVESVGNEEVTEEISGKNKSIFDIIIS